MKKIERPDSTTYLFEQSFHLIKNEEEAERVRQVIESSDPKPQIIPVMRMVDWETFEPMIAFAIYYEGDTFAECLKYVAKMGISPVEFEAKATTVRAIKPEEVKIL